MARGSYLLINTQAMAHNLRCVKQRHPQSRVLAMIKCDAYGHGLITAAQAFAAADALGVAFLEEALPLRGAGITTPIVLLEGFLNPIEIPQLIAERLIPVIHAEWQIQALEASEQSIPAVWLALDSGMHREGFHPSNFMAVYERLSLVTTVDTICTHFACADSLNSKITAQQMTVLKETTQALNLSLSACNSAAILTPPLQGLDWVRPGLMLYGSSPFSDVSAKALGLQPAMQLKAPIIDIKTLEAGETLGYGLQWCASTATRIALVALGYGDGYPRHAPNGTPAQIGSETAHLAGRVSMDMLTLDLTAAPNAQVGDEVTFWGDDIPIERIAEAAETISYDLLTRVHQRLARVII